MILAMDTVCPSDQLQQRQVMQGHDLIDRPVVPHRAVRCLHWKFLRQGDGGRQE
jgi:hypothetical protein